MQLVIYVMICMMILYDGDVVVMIGDDFGCVITNICSVADCRVYIQ